MSFQSGSSEILYALLCTFSLLTGAVKSEEEPRVPTITVPPSDTYSTEGVLEFICQAEGVPKPVINWYDATTQQQVIDRVPMSGSTSGIHVNQHYGRLMISNPTKNVLYRFYCNASNSVGWTISHPPVEGGLAYLESKFGQISSDKTVQEGDNVVLECRAPKGIPQPKVQWLKQDNLIASQELTNSTNQHEQSSTRVTEQGNLQIDTVGRVHSGTYTCVAINVAGRVQSSPIRLTVEPRVYFIEKPKDMRVRQGMNVKFKCKTEGNQLVQWSKDHGKGLIDPTRVELAEGYLLLKNVQLSDTGTYSCSAAGLATASAVLTVETPPAFSRTPDDLTVREGETAIFHCITTGFPKPSIYWELADKTPIFPTEGATEMRIQRRFFLHMDGRLEIRNVQVSDAGKYQCTAHSSVDRIHSSAMLHVIGSTASETGVSISENHDSSGKLLPPSHYLLVPVISLPPTNQTRMVGELVTLDCELGVGRTSSMMSIQPDLQNRHIAKAPDWTVSWHRATLSTNGFEEELKFSVFGDEQRFSLLPGGSLQIVDVTFEDTGTYTCSARALVHWHDFEAVNLIQSNWTAHLKVVPRGTPAPIDDSQENPLSPPRNLKVTNRTDTTITLAWDPVLAEGPADLHNSKHRIAYWVQFYRADHPFSGWLSVEQNWMANVVKIGGLLPSTAYFFLIRPRWAHGRVGWASAPLGPVTTLQTSPLSENQIVDTQFLGTIRGVQIHHVQLYALTPRRLRVSWEVKEKVAVLAMITGYTIYYRKASILGCVASSLDTLRNPAVSTANDATNVYCSLQLCSGCSMDELYYRFQELQQLRYLKSKETAHPVHTMNVDARVHQSFDHSQLDISDSTVYEGSGLLRDLDPFTCYEISVKAHLTDSSLGKIESRESIANSVLTFETFPSRPPERISAKWISVDSVELSWVAPPAADWNGLLTGYAIYLYDELAQSHQAFNVSYSQLKTSIKGLTSPNVYFVQMAGVNCKGVGIRSKPLRLNPQLKTIGLGSGWGYDDTNGQLLTMNQAQTEDRHFAQQPWFIVTLVISLLLWGAIMGLIAFCCRGHRGAIRKTAGGVFISSGSHGASTLIEPGTDIGNTSGSAEPVHSTGRYQGELNRMQMESLLNPSAFQADTNKAASQSVRAVTMISNTVPGREDHSTYGMYSMASGMEFSPNQWQLSRAAYLERDSPTVYTMNGTTNANPQHLHLMPDTCSRGMATHTLGIQLPTTSPIYTPSYCAQSPNGYLTYQPQVVSLSQSLTEFASPASVCERPSGFCSVAKMGPARASGLPLVAPVAQLGSHNGQFANHQNLPTIAKGTESTNSVTPYATASIIQSNIHSNHLSQPHCEPGLNNIRSNAFSSVPNSSRSYGLRSGQASFSSSDSTAAYVGNNKHVLLQPEEINNMLISKRTNNNAELVNMNLQTSTAVDRANDNCMRSLTPSKANHGTFSRDPRGTPSTQSKSDSTASTNTRPSDEKSRDWRNTSLDSTDAGSNKEHQIITNESGNHDFETQDDSVYSFADGPLIPPPPASPPPPAPRHLTNELRKPSDLVNCSFTENVLHYDTRPYKIPTNNLGTQRPHVPNGYSHAVYDLNAESTDDEHGQPSAGHLHAKRCIRQNFSRSSLSGRNDCLKLPMILSNCELRQNSLTTDESTNSTYAQVY